MNVHFLNRFITGYGRDQDPRFGFSTERAHYVVEGEPGQEYIAHHKQILDKIHIGVATVNFLNEKPGHQYLLYEDLRKHRPALTGKVGRANLPGEARVR